MTSEALLHCERRRVIALCHNKYYSIVPSEATQ